MFIYIYIFIYVCVCVCVCVHVCTNYPRLSLKYFFSLLDKLKITSVRTSAFYEVKSVLLKLHLNLSFTFLTRSDVARFYVFEV